ncbi:MAG: phosphopantetheine-binding protein [Anaerolineales bacterium]|jgi:acyl carrier protein
MLHALEEKVTEILRALLKIEDDISLDVSADLVQQIGLDSIEAFDAVATVHEIIGQPIPNNFNPKVSNSIRLLAEYIQQEFGQEGAQKVLAADVADLLLNQEDDAL